jgi:K+/H+ antiporter YhaU regulatory subunit KhtT
MSRKSDTISYREFNKLTNYKTPNNAPLASKVLFDDENITEMEETLMGMEYDNEDLEELEDNEDLVEVRSDEQEQDSNLEFTDKELADMDADLNVELDESVYYQVRQST